MGWFDFNGNPITITYDFNGNPLDDKLRLVVFADSHGQFQWLGNVVDTIKASNNWNSTFLINLGDDTLNLNYESVQNQTNYALEPMKVQLDKIYSDRQIRLLGNHDVFWEDENGTIHLTNPHFPENHWIIDKFYPNPECTPLYGNDVAKVEGDVKFVSMSAWDNDGSLGGYSAYGINAEHMDALINELSKKDGNDIIILSHVPIFTMYDSKRIPATDGNTDHAEEWSADSIAKSSCRFDEMLKARNEHTYGTITDSYGNVHSYDFSDCDGRILFCIAGHEHRDMYGYRYGILQIIFDSVHYDQFPYFEVDWSDEYVHIKKVCTKDGSGYDFSLPIN